MAGTSERLRQRARRRVEWLAAATNRFEDDERVAAAWVFGSEGRGDADELSDLDLFVAIAAGSAEIVTSLDRTTFEDFGDVVTFEDVSELAPDGGRAFEVGYPAPVERLTVHWWFQLVDGVQLGNDVEVLVDKVGVPVADPPATTATMLRGRASIRAGGPRSRRSPRRADRLQERVTWFWKTSPVVAKWLARGWVDRADSDLARMQTVVDEALAFLNRQPPERHAESGPVRPLSRLRAVMVELSHLADGLIESGVEVPSTDVAYGWLELAEDLEAERWMPNSTK